MPEFTTKIEHEEFDRGMREIAARVYTLVAARFGDDNGAHWSVASRTRNELLNLNVMSHQVMTGAIVSPKVDDSSKL